MGSQTVGRVAPEPMKPPEPIAQKLVVELMLPLALDAA
jgi:hypothetical protein